MSVVANVAINVDSRGAVSKLREVQTQATATQRAFGALQSAIAGIGVASIAAQTLKAAASFNDLQTRLKLLTSEYGEYTQAQQFAAKAAKQFGLSNREAATSVSDIYGRLRPLGVSLKDIQSTFNGFNTIARLSGVSAEGASAAFLQLGQALGSGRLQGDEFRSIAEQVPGLLVAVSKETGIAAKDLKQFASDGKLSADIVINALKRIESEGAGKIAALVQNSDTQKFKDLQNAVDDLSVAVGNELLPLVTPLIKDLTSLVGTIAALPDPVKNATGEIIKLIIQLVLVEKAIKAIIALRLGFIGAMVGMTGATVASGAAATTSAGAFALYTNNTRALQAQAAAATPVLNGLLGTLGRLAAIGAIAIVVNVAVTGMAALLQASAEIAKLRGQRNQPGGAAGDFGGSITPQQRKENEKTLAAIKKERESPEFKGQQASAALGIGKTAYNSRVAQLQEREIAARARLALPNTPATPTTPTPTPTAGGGGGGGGAGAAANDAKRAADEAAREAQRVADVVRDQQFITKQKGIQTKFAQLIFDAEQSADPIRVRQLQTVEALVLAGNETARLLEAEENGVARLAIARTRQGEAEAIRQEGLQDVLKLQIEQKKNFDEIIASLDLELALKTATTEQAREQLRLEAEIAKLKGQGFTPEQIGTITAKKTELARPKTDRERLEGAAAGVKAELDALTDPINMITTAAAGIGDAFSTSFKGIISGSMTAKEALASFFTSVADMFLDMAAQIIAKMIQMAILNAIVSLLPGSSGGGLGSSQFKPGAPAQMVPSLPNAQNYSGAFKARAKGGPVSSGQTYMVGERGPELFVPGRSGTIVANDKMGGGSTNVIVNVDAKGSSVEGNEQGANQLGRVISAAVQSELIKQQRPGGILAR